MADLIPEIERAMAVVALIDQLRAEEGHSVMINCDNPHGPPDAAIEVCADWTDWEWLTFPGDSVLECLRAAVEASKRP